VRYPWGVTRGAELEGLAASILMVGFPGHHPEGDLRDLVGRGLAGAILFRRNIVDPQQVFDLCHELKALAGTTPFLCSVDQEGGRVARLREGFTQLPAMHAVGRVQDETLATEVGSVIGEECRAVGFDIDFAPVLDVASNPANPVIGDRSFGQDAELCATMGAAMVRGIQSRSVAACGKHLPGHGDTQQDSHLELPYLAHGWERLEAVELVPFRRAIDVGVASLMTAHIVFTALDDERPITLSVRALGELRQRLHLTGEAAPPIISDDLEMAAITERWEIGNAAPMALAAGCDLLLVCHRIDRQQAALEALCRHAESGEGRAQLERAARRVKRFAQTWARPAVRFDPTRLRRPEALRLMARFTSEGIAADPTEA